MANPQCENGYTRIANEIMEALAKLRIPGEARQILDVIIRETYGCNRKQVKLKSGFLSKKTGLKRQNVSRGIKKLTDMNLISVIKNDYVIKSDYIHEITFNKNYEKWIASSKTITHVASSKTITPVINIDSLPYKETIKKQKDIMSSAKANGRIPYKEIVDYLNQKTSKSFNPSTKNTQQHIKARWNEGFRIDDFKRVIDVKTVQWLANAEMNQYLRPQTLFNTKFEAYLNETGKDGKETNDDKWARFCKKLETD